MSYLIAEPRIVAAAAAEVAGTTRAAGPLWADQNPGLTRLADTWMLGE